MDTQTGEKVAIKKYDKPIQDEMFARRAFRELNLMKRLNHKNVSVFVVCVIVSACMSM